MAHDPQYLLAAVGASKSLLANDLKEQAVAHLSTIAKEDPEYLKQNSEWIPRFEAALGKTMQEIEVRGIDYS